MASNKPPRNKNKRNYKKSRRDLAKPNEKGYFHYQSEMALKKSHSKKGEKVK